MFSESQRHIFARNDVFWRSECKNWCRGGYRQLVEPKESIWYAFSHMPARRTKSAKSNRWVDILDIIINKNFGDYRFRHIWYSEVEFHTFPSTCIVALTALCQRVMRISHNTMNTTARTFIPEVLVDVATVDSGDTVDVCVVVGKTDDGAIAVKHGNTI